MKDRKKIYALAGTLLFHTMLVLLLLWSSFSRVIPQGEEGIEVQFGNIDMASGTFEPNDIAQEENTQTTSADNTPVSEEVNITQNDEESAYMEAQQKKAALAAAQKRQKEAEERRQSEEARRINEATAKAFSGKGVANESRGNATSGKGTQGNINGNSNNGALEGIGGEGSYDLGGRQATGNGIPYPTISLLKSEGKIVVKIIVNPRGEVISADITRGTTIDDSQLRSQTINAAKRARFDAINGLQNQEGTITYRFNYKR